MVSHGGVLHYFTEDWENSSQFQGKLDLHSILSRRNLTGYSGTGWVNTEYRTYAFSDRVDLDDLEDHRLDSDNASLVETLESRQGRGKKGPMAERDQQKIFYREGVEGWNAQGLQLSTAEREAAKVPAGKEVDGVRV